MNDKECGRLAGNGTEGGNGGLEGGGGGNGGAGGCDIIGNWDWYDWVPLKWLL